MVRHAKAEGQEPEAPLTPEGLEQAERLADLLASRGIDQVISSPFRRRSLTNPDVYTVTVEAAGARMERLWR